MATEVLMPKMGLTMTEGTIEEWKKKEGDAVKVGDVLFSVATDKLTNDVECDTDGTLLKILFGEGETRLDRRCGRSRSRRCRSSRVRTCGGFCRSCCGRCTRRCRRRGKPHRKPRAGRVRSGNALCPQAGKGQGL